MVSTIVPGAAGAGALGAEHRFTRSPTAPQSRDAAPLSDRVEMSSASLAAARESVREAVAQVHQALAIGQEAQAMLVKAQGLARSGGEDAQAELTSMLDAYAGRVHAAAAQGALLVTGADVAILAEPGAAPITAPGVDLRLKENPRPGDVLLVAANAQVDDRELPQAIQGSLEALQAAMARLQDVARSLEAHQGVIGAAENAVMAGVRHDLDADGARLLALQVRQGLEAAGAQSIANAEPQAVLALFRA